MITCYNCGKQVSDETLICPECGALVRRYEAPVREPYTDNPQQPNRPVFQRQTVPQTKPGKLWFPGGFKVWFWLCMAFFVIYTFSFSVTGLSFLRPNDVTQMLVQLYESMDVDLVQTFGSLETVGIYMLINAAGCIVEGILLLQLYIVRSIRALLLQLIITAVLAVALAILVGVNMICLAVLLCAAVTFLCLRRQIPRRKG